MKARPVPRCPKGCIAGARPARSSDPDFNSWKCGNVDCGETFVTKSAAMVMMTESEESVIASANAEPDSSEIERALDETGGNGAKAAELLGMPLRTFRRRTSELGLKKTYEPRALNRLAPTSPMEEIGNLMRWLDHPEGIAEIRIVLKSGLEVSVHAPEVSKP